MLIEQYSASLTDHSLTVSRPSIIEITCEFPEISSITRFSAKKRSFKDPKSSIDSRRNAMSEEESERSREVVQRIAEEVEFVVENFDFALEPGRALENYMHSRNMLNVLLFLNMIYEVCLLVYLVYNYEFIMSQLGEIYRNLSI
jgi:hypothetical protein